MDTKIAALSGILVMILAGSGLLVLLDNPADDSDNDIDKEEITEPVVVLNQPPVVMFSEQSKMWDGTNISINGFAMDELIGSSTVTIRFIDSFTAIEPFEPISTTIDASGSWSLEIPLSEPGQWVAEVFVTDFEGLNSASSFENVTIVAPVENDVVISFQWDEPADESSNGTLNGVLIHRFTETCAVEYRPKYQSPTLDVIGVVTTETGEFTMTFDTDNVNTNGTIYATCGLFSTSSDMVMVNLPVPPEPVGDNDLDGILDDVDQCNGTPQGEPVYQSGCSDSELDDDMDNVYNDQDLCPDTPSGELVDSNGCALSQKDTDGDGVSNSDDNCPNTPNGESVDSFGCSDSQKDTDNDGVSDDVDQCPNTPSGDIVGADGCTLPDWAPEDSWLCLNGQGDWVKDLNGEGNSYTANTRGAGQSGGGGGSGPWFQCDVSVTITNSEMQINSNAIPNHNWLSAFAANANEQNMDWTIPLNPVEDTSGGHNSANCPAANGAYECAPDRGAVAVAVNGVPIFGPEEGPGGDAVALEYLYFDEDRQPIDLGYCGAHNGPGGVHYHYDAMCQFWDDPNGETIVNYDYTDLDSTTHSPIIGWAFDGYPIYGMYGWDENGQVIPLKSSYEVERTSEGGDQGYNGIDDWNYVNGMGELDQCNGRFATTPEYPEGTYYYVSTPLSGSSKTVVDTDGNTVSMIGFPYFLLCYHGVADMSNANSGGGGGGGGPRDFQAMVLYEHMPELLEDTRELNFDFKKLIWNSSYLWLAIIGLVLFFHRRK